MIIAKKIKMSRIFDENSKAIPVTILEVIPSSIIECSGSKIMLANSSTKAKKPQLELLKKADYKSGNVYVNPKELSFYDNEGKLDWDQISIGREVSIQGTSKGKGFAGTVKRHGFSRGPKTHGSHNYRAPGSIGSAYPQRVILGTRMPGHLGYETVTIKNTKIIEIDKINNLIAVKGSVPGANRSYLKIVAK